MSCVVYIPGVAPAWPSRAGISRTSGMYKAPAKEYIKISNYMPGERVFGEFSAVMNGDEITTNQQNQKCMVKRFMSPRDGVTTSFSSFRRRCRALGNAGVGAALSATLRCRGYPGSASTC